MPLARPSNLLVKSMHKWVGLFVGAQLLLWTASGLIFAWLDDHQVTAEHSVRSPASAVLSGPLSEPGRWLSDYSQEDVLEVRLMPLLEQWVYWVKLANRIDLRRADNGERIEIDDARIRDLALAHYVGEGTLRQVVRLAQPTVEARGAGSVWQAEFDDRHPTRLYFSAEDGQFVAARNDTWRVFDFFWMLHTMDYRGRDNINNPLVILASSGAVWMGLTGLLLVFRTFRRDDFKVFASFMARGAQARIALVNAETQSVSNIELPFTGSLYGALQVAGIELPSNCGGGGSCGLCAIRYLKAVPELAAEERVLLPSADLERGYRLACRHPVADEDTIEIAGTVLSARPRLVEVAATRFLTPTIKELRLRAISAKPFEFRAGDYMQVEIPRHRIPIVALDIPQAHQRVWSAWRSNAVSVAPRPVRRAYSMANYPGEWPSEVVLNVRFAPPPVDRAMLSCGNGSTYLFHSRTGDRLTLRGPFGTFHANASEREMIFIGGGAGMAPLRSILFDDLYRKGSRRVISYWYGARTEQDLFYAAEFEELARQFKNFSWHVALSQPTGDAEKARRAGFIHQVVLTEYLERHSDPASCEYYLCGPPAMLSACRTMLAALSVPDQQIFFDDFGS